VKYKNINNICDEYLTRSQLAEYLSISERKLSSMVASREIPVVKIGRCVRFRKSEVDKALQKFTIQAE